MAFIALQGIGEGFRIMHSSTQALLQVGAKRISVQVIETKGFGVCLLWTHPSGPAPAVHCLGGAAPLQKSFAFPPCQQVLGEAWCSGGFHIAFPWSNHGPL